jgi:hypothetical protein
LFLTGIGSAISAQNVAVAVFPAGVVPAVADAVTVD